MRLLVATWGSPLAWRRAKYTGVPPLNCPEGQTFTGLSWYRGMVDKVVAISTTFPSHVGQAMYKAAAEVLKGTV